MLTHADVHSIRTEGLTDAYFADLYGVSRSHVRAARIGEAYRGHPTPPDTRRRSQGGRRAPIEAVYAVERPQTISQALRAWRTPHPTAEHA